MDIHIMLVDDEAIDLEWLRRRVAAYEYDGLHVVGTADSGFAALRAMEQERIDIILSDIRMPIMSGMEFVRRARELQPQVQVVFISGHKDFDYAQEAIGLGAAGYLLKPVDDGELNEMLRKLCARIKQEREQSSSLLATLSLVNEELLLRWFHDYRAEQVEQHVQAFLQPLLADGVSVALMEIDDLAWRIKTLSEAEQRLLIGEITSFIQTFAAAHSMGVALSSHDDRFVLLARVKEDYLASLLTELLESFRQSFPYTLTIGLGRYAYTFEELHDSHRQAQAALSIKWIVGKNRLIRDASEWSPKAPTASKLDEHVERMLQAMVDYDLVTVDDCLLQMFSGDEPISQKNDVYDRIIRITSKLHADLLQMNVDLYDILKWDSHRPVVLFQFDTVEDILSWLRRRFFELSELLYARNQRQRRKLIEEIIAYVHEHIEDKVTLAKVAEQFNFTPNHLGRLFKNEMNMLFSDFLAEVRMKRVCELLAQPTMKIYEIAERAGYKNIIYFNRQFKQAMGMSPGEYRKKHKI